MVDIKRHANFYIIDNFASYLPARSFVYSFIVCLLVCLLCLFSKLCVFLVLDSQLSGIKPLQLPLCCLLNFVHNNNENHITITLMRGIQAQMALNTQNTKWNYDHFSWISKGTFFHEHLEMMSNYVIFNFQHGSEMRPRPKILGKGIQQLHLFPPNTTSRHTCISIGRSGL